MIVETEVCAAPRTPRGMCADMLARWWLTAACFVALSFAANAFAVTGYSVRSDVDRNLYRIDLDTGVATVLGDTTFNKIEGLAMNAAGDLYGVNPSTAQLVRCSTSTGACTAVGTMSVVAAPSNVGLAFGANGQLYLSMSAIVYVVDPTNANATPIGASGAAISGLAAANGPTADCGSGLYAIGGNSDQGKLYCISLTNGAATQIGTLSAPIALDGGLDADPQTGLIWGITNGATSQIYSFDPLAPRPPVVSNVRPVTVSGAAAGGFESLAVVRSTPPVVGPANGLFVVPLWSGGWAFGLASLLVAAVAWRSRRLV